MFQVISTFFPEFSRNGRLKWEFWEKLNSQGILHAENKSKSDSFPSTRRWISQTWQRKWKKFSCRFAAHCWKSSAGSTSEDFAPGKRRRVRKRPLINIIHVVFATKRVPKANKNGESTAGMIEFRCLCWHTNYGNRVRESTNTEQMQIRR